jgi:toxin ParE1/3/4
VAQVFNSPEADEDLAEIWLYIALDNVDAADRVLDSIQQKAKALLKHPELGRKREDLAPSLRSLVVGNYQLFYQISGKDIEIVRVLHGSRGIERIFSN